MPSSEGKQWKHSFRYLDQLGRLAAKGVQVHIHNTLASSDYGLLDENTFAPRPNYWAALLWHKLMGTTVLDPGPSPATSLHLYAHCLRGREAGVAVLAINLDRAKSQAIDIPVSAERYTLTARNLSDTRVQMNGSDFELRAHDELPALTGTATASGPVSFAPTNIPFLAIPDAHNTTCR
jgi:heparanase 1